MNFKGKSYGHVVQYLWQSCLRNNIEPTKTLINQINDFIRSDYGQKSIESLISKKGEPDDFKALWQIFLKTYEIKEREVG